ncbi:hypothetical protein Vretimale_9631 [Volvox reticuliferus]|uniref:Uncharacterized protein n=2 Tax=Volvox reticuliferus TaxID=1737510 RepID=A0A8J4GDX6_9CHLO|nr:hypothetical protein Vretimale_9631 [Volvox reticuliferus]
MGCAASAPQDVDTLPIKAHCRTAFSRCSTTERVNGQTSERNLCHPAEEGHDVVLCYPLGGTVFGLELQARYEKMDSVSLWTLDHFQSIPGTPIGVCKSMSGGIRSGSDAQPKLEIKPAPEATEAAMSSNAALSREIRMCRRGVVVLVTAGCTWDDGVLNCLRLAGRFLRPLVMVHCVQSCPLPALEEWPLDIRPLIAASGPPIKYLTQHSAEALRGVEQRMIAAAEALVRTTVEARKGTASTEQGQLQQQQQARQQETETGLMQSQTLQQPPAVSSHYCSCLDDTLWASPAPSRPALPAQQQQQPTKQPAGGAGSPAAASTQPRSTAPNDSNADAPRLFSSPSPLSLVALQASDSEICRRASQLLGPWTCASTKRSSDAAATADAASNPSNSASTPVEALVVSAQPSYHGGSVAEQAIVPLPGSTAWQQPPRHVQYAEWGQGEEQKLGQIARNGSAVAVGGSYDSVRCVLRYRDPGWAIPVAFVCAQLEAELGRANVSVQIAAANATGAALAPPRVSLKGRSARLSLQSMDSGGNWSHKGRQQERHQQQRAILATGSDADAADPAAANAAATSLQGCQRSSSGGSGSSRCCSASCGPRVSGSTSRRTSCGASLPTARADDELEAFMTPSADECAMPPRTASMARRFCSSCADQPMACTAAPAAQLDARSMSWSEEEPEPRRKAGGDSGGDDGGAASISACLVYFMTPGLSAPLGCLADLGCLIAQGRQILLVVDGECCQRLPDFVPAGMMPEAWKAVKRLWHERLLYVADYHTPFCALLKQGIAGAAAATAATAQF